MRSKYDQRDPGPPSKEAKEWMTDCKHEYRHDEWCALGPSSPWPDEKCTCYVHLLEEKDAENAALKQELRAERKLHLQTLQDEGRISIHDYEKAMQELALLESLQEQK